jgi:dienelactone hydrolase/DNA-binding beta-propeller fold protein YncE
MKHSIWILAIVLLNAPSLFGEETFQQTDDPAQVPFYADKTNLLVWQGEQGKSFSIENESEWQNRRAHIIRNMEQVMGRLPRRDPSMVLDVQVLESERLEKVTRKKITYLAGKGDRVPAYLLIPNGLERPAPAMICLHGTSGPRGRTAGVGPDYPRYTLELAERGYVTIAPDYTLLGDNQTDPESVGYTSGTMKGIWGHMRAVDLLESLPEVDKERIGCCGVSLGGHNSLFLAAFDPRMKVVVCSSGFDSFADYMDGNLTGWCQKRYMPSIASKYDKDPKRLPFDFPEVLAAIAPRSLYIHAPKDDNNFKVDSARRCVQSASAVYRLLGAEHSLVAVYPSGPHGYPIEERERSYAFIDQVLNARQDSGTERYEIDPDFKATLPDGIEWGEVSGVAVDSKGYLIISHRGPRPILIYDPSGKLVQMFGDSEITAIHGTRVDVEDNIWVTDYRNHTVIKYSPTGKVLLLLGKRDVPGNDSATFNRATDVAVAPNGDFFVSDGYGNNRIVKFSPTGDFVKTWGVRGKAEGEMNLPHAVQFDALGLLHVADRENNRVQVFDQNGAFVRSYGGFAPFGLTIAPDQTLFVADGRENKCLHMTLYGKVLSEWGSQGSGPGQFQLPHCIAVDRNGNVYVGEVGGKRIQRFVRK